MAKQKKRRSQTAPVVVRIPETGAQPAPAGGERKEFWFVQLPIEVIRDRKLSAGAVRLYADLAAYANADKACWPGQARLADDLGVSVRTVYAYLKELERAGYITITRRGKRATNLYCLPGLPGRGDRKSAPGRAEVTGSRPAPVIGSKLPGNQNPTNNTQHREERNRAAGAAAGPPDSVLRMYETEIGPVTPLVRRKLAELANAFSASEVESALAEAAYYNARHKLAYAVRVLERRRSEGRLENTSEVAEMPDEAAPEQHSRPVLPRPAIGVPVNTLFADTDVAYTFAEIWFAAMSQLRPQMDRPAFEWICGAQVVDLEGDTLVICAPSRYAKEMLEQRLLSVLVRMVSDLAGRPVTLRVVLGEEYARTT